MLHAVTATSDLRVCVDKLTPWLLGSRNPEHKHNYSASVCTFQYTAQNKRAKTNSVRMGNTVQLHTRPKRPGWRQGAHSTAHRTHTPSRSWRCRWQQSSRPKRSPCLLLTSHAAPPAVTAAMCRNGLLVAAVAAASPFQQYRFEEDAMPQRG